MSATRVPDGAEASAPLAAGPRTGGAGGVVGGAGWLGLGAGISKASQTLVLLVLAVLLEPSAIGVLAIGALVLNVCSALTDLGTSMALVPWRGDAERAARSALTLALGLAAVLTGAAWVVAPTLSAALGVGADGVPVIRGLMCCLPFFAISGVTHELLRRDLAFKRRVLPDIVGAVVGGAVSIGLAADGRGATSLVVGQIVQAAVVTVLCFAVRRPVVPGWHRGDVVGLLRYGGHLAGADVATLVMLNVDYLVVSHLLGATALGVYSMAFRLAYMPYILVASVIGGAAFAHLCRRRGAEVGEALTDAVVVLAAVMLPAYVGMLVLAPQLELLGHQWAAGVPALRWLAVYGLLLSALHLCLVGFRSVGRPGDALLVTAVHLVLLTGLLLLLTGGGVAGAGTAQAVAVAGTLALATALVGRRVEGISWRRLARRLAPALAGAVCLAATVLAGEVLLPWTQVSVVGLLLLGTAGLGAYLVPVLADRRVRQDLLHALGRRR